MFRHFGRLSKLGRDDVTIVIHDPSEISGHKQPYLKRWNIITIRRSMRHFQREREKFGVESDFLYHPFYQYLIDHDAISDSDRRTEAVSTCRIDFLKNIETSFWRQTRKQRCWSNSTAGPTNKNMYLSWTPP